MPTSVSKMVEALEYNIQASCHHLNPVISSLKDEQYSLEGSQCHFHVVIIPLMMTSGQCHLGVLLTWHILKNQAQREGLRQLCCLEETRDQRTSSGAKFEAQPNRRTMKKVFL